MTVGGGGGLAAVVAAAAVAEAVTAVVVVVAVAVAAAADVAGVGVRARLPPPAAIGKRGSERWGWARPRPQCRPSSGRFHGQAAAAAREQVVVSAAAGQTESALVGAAAEATAVAVAAMASAWASASSSAPSRLGAHPCDGARPLLLQGRHHRLAAAAVPRHRMRRVSPTAAADPCPPMAVRQQLPPPAPWSGCNSSGRCGTESRGGVPPPPTTMRGCRVSLRRPRRRPGGCRAARPSGHRPRDGGASRLRRRLS